MAEKPTYAELERQIQDLEKAEIERKRTEQALLESDERFRQVYKHMAVGVAQVSLEFQIKGANEAYCSMLGYREEELIGKHLRDITHPESVEENLRKQSLLAGGEIDHYRMEKCFAHKNGRVIHGILDANLVRDAEGKPLYFLGSVLDITERKQAEEALLVSQGKLSAMMDSLTDHMSMMDRDLNILWANDTAKALFGEDLIGKKCYQAYHGRNAPCEPYPCLTLKAFEEDRSHTHETQVTGKDGQTRYFHCTANAALRDKNGNPMAVIEISRDITDRKQIEEALRQSTERLKIAGEIAYDIIYEWTVADNRIEWFGSIDEKLGYDRNEIPKTIEGWGNLIHPEDSIRLNDAVELHKLSTTPINYEYRVRHKDGSWRFWNDKGLPILNNEGLPYKWIGVCTDITESKERAEELRESKGRLQNIVNNAVMGIYQVTHDGKFLLVNTKLARMFGFNSPEEFLSSVENIHQLYVHPEERPAILENIKARDFVDGVEIQFWNRDGQIIINRVSVRVIEDKTKGTIYEGFMADITDHKRAEEALRDSEEKLTRSNKMESLGLLAGGVAHDLNNVLSGIVSYPELLLLDLPQDSKFRGPIETIQESGQRAVAIVQDLLTVARGVAITTEPLNLNELVRSYIKSPEFNKLEKYHPTVTFKTNLDAELLNISGSHVHIRKVVMNLASNASEAIENSGKVTISTMNSYIDRPLSGYDDVNIGEYAVLSVSDDGLGISPDDLKRMFEPFYTKKVMGRSGTGLGLAVVWNVVQDHKGYIDVKSDENGTIFELYFPIIRAEISAKALSKPIEYYKGNGETILVVDDVKTQRDISCTMLERLGYKTKAVSSGEEAAEYMEDNAMDLILLDMIMDPGINGRETYERILKIHPNQKAIIVSGFAETDDVKEVQNLGAGKFIKKPLTLERVGLAVKEQLEK